MLSLFVTLNSFTHTLLHTLDFELAQIEYDFFCDLTDVVYIREKRRR